MRGRALVDYHGLYLTIGPPGTGKTTWLATQIRAIAERARVLSRGARVLVCSLTRTAAAEIAGRDLEISPGAIGTLHAHCFRALERPELAERHFAEWNALYPDLMLMGEGVDVDEASFDGRGLSEGDRVYARYHLLRARRVASESYPFRVRAFAERFTAWKAEKGYLDFTDLIEQCFNEGLGPPGDPEIVICDEAQDLSRLELDLLLEWGRKAGAVILAGDPWQALYTWRGAMPAIFFDATVPEDHRRVLRQSYRLPVAVHTVATAWIRRHLSDFQPIDFLPRPEPGIVRHYLAGDWRHPERIFHEIVTRLEGGPGRVMVSASCGYMLQPLLGLAREVGLPFSNPWRLRRGDWNPLGARRGLSSVDRLMAFLAVLDREIAPMWRREDLSRWIEPLRSKGLLKHGAKKLAEAWAEEPIGGYGGPDMSDWIALFEPEAAEELWATACTKGGKYGEAEASDRAMVKWYVERLLPARVSAFEFPVAVWEKRGVAGLTEAPRLHFGTIHSFKGAEADTVYLFPDLSGQALEGMAHTEGRDEVARMFYVGMTRAKNELVFLAPYIPRYSVSFGGLTA
jgi:superfamily I DNA/RNA helicase